MIEANPRASRTVPFVAKATGVPLVKVAARVMVGDSLAELRDEGLLKPGVQRRLRGREGGGAALQPLPRRRPRARPRDAVDGRGDGHRHHLRPGVRQEPDRGGRHRCRSAARCSSRWPTATRPSVPRPPAGSPSLGFSIAATSGTADHLEAAGVPVATRVAKLGDTDGNGVDAVELIESGQIDLVVNSPRGRGPRADGAHIRTAAGVALIPCLTTAAAGPGRGARHGRLGPPPPAGAEPAGLPRRPARRPAVPPAGRRVTRLAATFGVRSCTVTVHPRTRNRGWA